jgi:hypothetical protein
MSTIWILDWKSSTAIFDEMRTQVVCYFKIYNSQYRTVESPVEQCGIIRLDKETGLIDDPPIVEVTDIEDRWKAFLHLREYYRLIIQPTVSDKKMDRWYKYQDKKFPTITTILDILNKPALPQWSANMTVDYVREHLKEMNTDEQIEYYLGKKGKAKTAYREISKKAMDTGSIVHDAIHAHLSGVKADDILKGNDKAENAFLAFLEWADKANLKPIALEKVLIDPEHEVGGTCDFIGEINE